MSKLNLDLLQNFIWSDIMRGNCHILLKIRELWEAKFVQSKSISYFHDVQLIASWNPQVSGGLVKTSV